MARVHTRRSDPAFTTMRKQHRLRLGVKHRQPARPSTRAKRPHTKMQFVTRPRGRPPGPLGTRNQIRRQRGQLLAGLFEFTFRFRRFDDAGAGPQPGLPVAFVGRSQRQRGIEPAV
jgi:hypothetical protein